MKKRVLHWVLPMHISETVHSVKQIGVLGAVGARFRPLFSLIMGSFWDVFLVKNKCEQPLAKAILKSARAPCSKQVHSEIDRRF
jgi:hypothetical protein